MQFSDILFIDHLVQIPFLLSDDSLKTIITGKGLKVVNFSFSGTNLGGLVLD